MTRRTRGQTPAVPRIYEGEAVLGGLLQSLGARLDVEGLKARVREAQERGEEPAAVFPALFEREPRFPSPEVALRLYANLFGLWDRIAAGGEIEPPARAAEPEAPEEEEESEPAPAPPPVGEGPLPDEFVEAAWRHLADLPDRELERLSHRYDNTQSELAETVRFEAGEGEVAVETADTLAFEIWAMLELARPKAKLRAVGVADLQKARASTETPEPALERYLSEALTEAELDEQTPLPPEESKRVLELVRAVVRALVAAQGRG